MAIRTVVQADDQQVLEGVSATPLPPAGAMQDVRIERQLRFDLYIGTKAALVAADVAQDGMFPGDTGRSPVSCSYDENGAPWGRRGGKTAPLAIQRRAKVFWVWKAVSAEETEKRRTEYKEAEEFRKLAAAADSEAAQALKELEELPATEDEFRLQVADMFWSVWNTVYRAHMQKAPGSSGFRFAANAIEEIKGLSLSLYWYIREDAETRFDARARMEKVHAARLKAAKVDAPLQVFLARTTRAASRHG